eukprot:g20614.t1
METQLRGNADLEEEARGRVAKTATPGPAMPPAAPPAGPPAVPPAVPAAPRLPTPAVPNSVKVGDVEKEVKASMEKEIRERLQTENFEAEVKEIRARLHANVEADAERSFGATFEAKRQSLEAEFARKELQLREEQEKSSEIFSGVWGRGVLEWKE